MRSLRTAGVIAVLAGCNYENPGFKVKGTADGSGASETSDSVSVSVSGTTTETSVSSAPPTTSTSEPIDPTTEPMTSMTSTTTGPDETSSGEAESSTGPKPPPVFPPECDEDAKEMVSFEVAADTYFAFNINDPGQCEELMEYCENTNTGRVSSRFVFNRDGYMTAFAVRFATSPIEYMGYPVPDDVVTLKLQMFVDREDQVNMGSVQLLVKRIAVADATWPEGDNDALKPCMADDSSFACRRCKDDTSCEEKWSGSIAGIIAAKGNEVADPIVVPKSYEKLTDVGLDAKVELPFFEMGHPGFLIVGADPVFENTLSIKAREAGEMFKPRLIARFCRPEE